MEYSKSKSEKTKDVRLSRIKIIIATVASIVTVITGILNLYDYIPHILFKIFLIAALLIFFTLLIDALLFRRALNRWIVARKNKALVKKYFDNFAQFSDRLGELLKDNYCNNIPYVFIHLRNMPPEFNNPRSLLYDIAGLFAVFKERLEKAYRKDFPSLIKWFESILQIYNRQLVRQPLQQIRNHYKDKLTDNDKEAYENSRENYVRFLQDYMNFARAINKSCGEKVAQEYFDQPGRL